MQRIKVLYESHISTDWYHDECRLKLEMQSDIFYECQILPTMLDNEHVLCYRCDSFAYMDGMSYSNFFKPLC